MSNVSTSLLGPQDGVPQGLTNPTAQAVPAETSELIKRDVGGTRVGTPPVPEATSNRCSDCGALLIHDPNCADESGSPVVVFDCSAGCGGARQFHVGDRAEGTLVTYRHGRTVTIRAHGTITKIGTWPDGRQFVCIQAPLGDPGRGELFYSPAAELSEAPSLEPSPAQREENLAIAAWYDRRHAAHMQALEDLKELRANGGDYAELRAAEARAERLGYAE